MKRSIINLLFVFISGILIGQNSKSSFEIIPINQKQTEDFIKASAYIERALDLAATIRDHTVKITD